MTPKGAAIMESRFESAAPLSIARIAGGLYIVILVAGIFAEFFVRSGLVVAGDAAATAANIVASEGLFRMGIVADLLMIASDIAVGLLFYLLLRPVSQGLALLAAFFRLAQAAILGANLLNLLVALELARPAAGAAGLGAGPAQALALLFIRAHGIGYALGLIFFGIYLFILGALILRSGYIPRVLGGMLMLAAAAYLADSFAQVLLANYAAYAWIFGPAVFVPALVAELALALWLLVRGVDGRRWRGAAPVAA